MVAVGKSNGGKQRQREVDVWAKVRTHVARHTSPTAARDETSRGVRWDQASRSRAVGPAHWEGGCAGKVGEVGARCRLPDARRGTRKRSERRDMVVEGAGRRTSSGLDMRSWNGFASASSTGGIKDDIWAWCGLAALGNRVKLSMLA